VLGEDMTQIAIVHPDLRSIGGAESVCMNILEALQSEYDVHLITYQGEHIEELNQSFNTTVNRDKLTIHQPQAIRLPSKIFQHRYSTVKEALRTLYLNRIASDFDLIISTKNELYVDTFTIHYIHNSRYPDYVEFDAETNIRRIYNTISRKIGGFDEYKLRDDCFLANSRWTANAVSSYYNVDPTVVYPPIDTTQFVDQEWSNRENGFLSIGQIEPRKRILENIDIIAELHDRGHDVHLHIIGTSHTHEYYQSVINKANKFDFVYIEGKLSFEELNTMICTHKYGIHGMLQEHFGMAIAEMVAGGIIPFVPNGGGQVEVVNNNNRLVYDSSEEAIENIDRVLSDSTIQQKLRANLREMKALFTKERFQQEFKTIVHQILTN
jgi:glycosyltransferase involved in cell wall biosynthesis